MRAAKADVAQLAERVLGKDEVTSSILVIGSSPRSPVVRRVRREVGGGREKQVSRGHRTRVPTRSQNERSTQRGNGAPPVRSEKTGGGAPGVRTTWLKKNSTAA